MKVIMSQVNPCVGDTKSNHSLIRESLMRGVAQEADVVLLPEMVTTGYPPRDLLYRQDIWEQQKVIADSLLSILRQTKEQITLIYGGIEQVHTVNGHYDRYNVAYIIDPDGIRVIRKRLLPCYDIFDETRYFRPCTDPITPVKIKLRDGKTKNCDVLICEDIWNADYRGVSWQSPSSYMEDPTQNLKGTGPLFVLNASPFWHGKIKATEALIRDVAGRLKRDIFWCNQVGAHDDIVTGGYSMACLVRDRVAKFKRCQAFAEDEMFVDTAVDVTRWGSKTTLGQWPYISFPQKFFGKEIDHADFETWCTYKALVLHIRDYFRRCGAKTAVIGASGGIDSALVTVLACDALGSQNVTTITMPSEYSSEGSVSDSSILAQTLKCRFEEQPIKEVYQAIRGTLLSGGRQKFQKGVTDENLQPRIRMIFLFAESNDYGQLVLTTGNKSEISMGYCTLYGDMSGGLGVIGDLWKTEVYEMALFINKYRGEIIPRSIINKPPSAELRPEQFDTDSLPSYDVLDPILQAHIEEDKTLPEIISLAETLVDPMPDVAKIIRQCVTSEYKRQQMPLTCKVSERAFGSGRRMPIACKITNL